MAATELFYNNPSGTAWTTLASNVTNAQTTITVTATPSGVTASNSATPPTQFRVLIGTEICIVTNISGTTWTVTRGAEGTTAASHTAGDSVNHIVTAGALTSANWTISTRTGVAVSGTTTSTRRTLDFIGGSNAVLSVTDDATNETAHITVNVGVPASASAVGMVLAGLASQTGDLLQFQDNSANVLARFLSDGGLVIGSNDGGGGTGALLSLGNVTTVPNGLPSGGGIVLYSQGGILKWRDGSGNVYDLSASASVGSAVKQPVKVATTSNITLSGLQTIDGVTVGSGDRVLVAGQSTGSQNGIYTAASGSWSRASDCNASGALVSGTNVMVTNGSVYGGNIGVSTITGTWTPGTTSSSWNFTNETAADVTLLVYAGALTGVTAGSTNLGSGYSIPRNTTLIMARVRTNVSNISKAGATSGLTIQLDCRRPGTGAWTSLSTFTISSTLDTTTGVGTWQTTSPLPLSLNQGDVIIPTIVTIPAGTGAQVGADATVDLVFA